MSYSHIALAAPSQLCSAWLTTATKMLDHIATQGTGCFTRGLHSDRIHLQPDTVGSAGYRTPLCTTGQTHGANTGKFLKKTTTYASVQLWWFYFGIQYDIFLLGSTHSIDERVYGGK